MSLLDDLEAEAESPGQKYPCTVCAALEALKDPRERAALEEAARNMVPTALIRVSRKHDLGFGRDGILKHRREEHKPT